MANLSINQTDGNNLFNVNSHISCKTSEYFKLNYDAVYKNHNQLLNNLMYDGCRLVCKLCHLRGLVFGMLKL